jgi:hypothetical protein
MWILNFLPDSFIVFVVNSILLVGVVIFAIVHIGWSRGVGYTSGEETFDNSITDISATKIRKELGLT